MKTDKLSQEERDVVSSNEDLHRYLVSLTKGRPATPRSWLYENDKTPEVTLDNWMRALESLKQGSTFEAEVYQFDTSQLEKWGPQGQVAPISELMDIVEEGFELGESSKPDLFDTHDWKFARDTVGRMLARATGGALRPASYKHVVDDMRARDTLNSKSGWPLYTDRTNPNTITASIQAAEDGTWKTYPAIALFRNYNNKTRLVWMYPMAVNLVEGSFFQPLQSALIANDIRTDVKARKHLATWGDSSHLHPEGTYWSEFAPWHGFESCRYMITRVYDEGNSEDRFVPTIAASDFSSTDAHFTKWQTLEVYECIKHCYQQQYWPQLLESLLYMQEIPLIVGEDSKITGLHGVSSGSNWTNFIETIFDIILGTYVDFNMNPSFAKTKDYLSHDRIWHAKCLYAIGDDMAWYCDWYDEGFATQLEEVGKQVGQQIKSDKTTNYPGKVKTLQRLFQRGYNRPDGMCRGVYPTIRALKSSVYPERFHKPKLWSSDMFCARQYMILENCVDHPLFEDFVKFVVHGQKDLIPFAHKSARDLDKILRETKLLPGFNPTYNQEKRDVSLGSFASINIAAKL